jgi:hypothetical protein
MDFDTVFFWLAVISSGVLFVRMAPHLRTGRGLGWAVVIGFIVTALLGGLPPRGCVIKSRCNTLPLRRFFFLLAGSSCIRCAFGS